MKNATLILVALIVLLSVCFWFRHIKETTNRQAFEAGAYLIVMNHKVFGHYGSQAMRKYVFTEYLMEKKALPQTEEEMRKIVKVVDEMYKGFDNVKEMSR